MEIKNEQLNQIFLKHEGNINKYLLWKFITAITVIVSSIVLGVIPIFKVNVFSELGAVSEEFYSFFGLFGYDYESALDAMGVYVSGGISITSLMKIFLGTTLIFPISIILLEAKGIYDFLRKDNRRTFMYFEKIFSGNSNEGAKFIKNQQQVIYMFSYIAFMFIDLLMLKTILEIDSGVAWTIVFPALMFVGYFLVYLKTNKQRKELEFAIIKDKYENKI